MKPAGLWGLMLITKGSFSFLSFWVNGPFLHRSMMFTRNCQCLLTHCNRQHTHATHATQANELVRTRVYKTVIIFPLHLRRRRLHDREHLHPLDHVHLLCAEGQRCEDTAAHRNCDHLLAGKRGVTVSASDLVKVADTSRNNWGSF